MFLASKVSAYNRARKWKIFNEVIHPVECTKILDVGYTEDEKSENNNYLEKHYPYLENITALGIEKPNRFQQLYPQIKCVTYNGKIFPFKNKEFDVVWSNAVIEHVGDINSQLLFLKEIKRVGKGAFITTPNKFFPIEVHSLTPLLHFLPKKLFDKYLKLIGKGWISGNYMNLLSLQKVKLILKRVGVTKYTIIKNKILFFTLDFVIIF
jgi:SAM-dependent methyltransferase